MTIEKVKEKLRTDYESPAWKLVERIVDEMNKRGSLRETAYPY